MATSSAQTSIEDIVTCSICMERMKKPKHLHCQHAFCEDCLKNWITQPGNSKRSISCPVCRHVTPVRRGVHMLPTDIGVMRLLDMLDQQEQAGSSGLVCGKDGAAAAAFCESCSYHLCRDCVDDHVQNQALWSHLLYLDDVCCSRHPGAVQDLYCQQCDRVGCRRCLTQQHRNHSIIQLADVAETNRNSTRYLLESLKDVMNSAEKNPDMNSFFSLESKLEELKQEIESHASKNHAAVDVWKKTIFATLKQKSDKLAKEVSGVEAQLEACNSLVSFISQFLEEASDYQLVAAFSATSQKLHQASDSLDEVASRRRPEDFDISFIDVPVPQTCGVLISPHQERHGLQAGNEQHIDANKYPSSGTMKQHSDSRAGEPVVDSAPSTSANSPTTHQGTNRGQSVPKTMAFDALVWENDGTIMQKALHRGHYIISHMLKDFTQWLAGGKDENLQAPVTVFMCNKSGFLYVGEFGWWTSGALHRYKSCTDLSPNPQPLSRLVMVDIYPRSIAVSPTNGTIATSVASFIRCHENGVIPGWRGETIPTSPYNPTSISAPYGIAIADDDQWVVVDHWNSLVGIYKDCSGTLKHIATYGSHGNGPREFHRPTGVCCDSVRDRFIVSDTGNGRIQVFNMSGDYLWEADGAGCGRALRKPRGLCLDGLGNILVADTGNKRIAVLGWERGDWLRDIELDFMPHSVTVDGRERDVAYLVVAGLSGKMPVIKTLRFHPRQFYGWWE